VRRASWAVEHVIQGAGIRLEDADARIIALAEVALEKCYYIDRAAEWLINRLDPKRWNGRQR
jgi:hypothetical protein